MAKTLEELILIHKTALRHLWSRESKLLALGKKPVNKKVSNVVKTHHEESNVWSNFSDSFNGDLTRNLNVYQWRLREELKKRNVRRSYRLNSASRDILMRHRTPLCGGKMVEGDAPIVKVEQGQLQGREVTTPNGKSFYSFQGVPYARPPLGSLRFKAPQAPEAWEGIRDATAEGNISAQIDPLIHKQYVGDENCLFLNVYTPNLDGEFLPVMVFIHGGGFKFGSGNSSMYGADYLVDKDVVVVTINYRCGALGFLSLNTPEVPGNAGLKDIVQAIRWVKENIHNFGGNSGSITVFGESCGGVAVSILTASPLTKNLISKAIIQSGTALNSWAFQRNPLENARNLAKLLGCESGDVDDILEFLTATPVKEIVEANEKMHPPEIFAEKGTNIFAPVVEIEFTGVEAVLTEAFIDLLTSGRVAEIPIIIGSTTLEFSFERKTDDLQSFIPEDLHIEKNSPESLTIAENIKNLYFKGNHTEVESLNDYFELTSDKLVNIDTHRYIQYLVQVTNKPIYVYKFDYVGELNLSKRLLNSLGLTHAGHMDELGYLFKNDFQGEVEPSPQDQKMRERMLRLWTNFAKCGNPTPDENHYLTVTWQPVTKDTLYYINLSNELSLETNRDQERMQFWDALYSKYYRLWEHPKPQEQAETGYLEQVVTPSNEQNTELPPRKEPDGVIEETIVELVEDQNKEPHLVVTENLLAVDENDVVLEQLPVGVDEIKLEEGTIVELVEDENNDAHLVVTEIVDESEVAINAPHDDNDAVIAQAPHDDNDAVIAQTPHVDEIPVHEIQVDELPEPPTQEPAQVNGNGVEQKAKPRTSNEIKMLQQTNGDPKDVIRASDPPEDDLPKNIGVNKFVSFFNSLGGKK